MSADLEKKILIIEDDPDIAGLLRIHLQDLGYGVDHRGDGKSGLERALQADYALIILDLMLPGLDGYEVCKRIREKNKVVSIMILTLKSEVADKILGLELGADDYLTKPFSVQELLARIRALLRRAQSICEPERNKGVHQVRVKDLVIDVARRRVTAFKKEIEFTRKEFDLLLFLASNAGRVFRRDELLNRVWDYDSIGYEHTVDTHINRLRAKIEANPAKPRYIVTVWGVGYRFADPLELK